MGRLRGITHLLEQGVPMDVVSKYAGHANTDMTEGQYGWVTQELAQQQISAVNAGLNGGQKPASTSTLSPDVMKMAMEYSLSTEQPLEDVLAILVGSGTAQAAE